MRRYKVLAFTFRAKALGFVTTFVRPEHLAEYNACVCTVAPDGDGPHSRIKWD